MHTLTTFFYKRLTRQLFSVLLLLTFIVSANAQINREDWQMNPSKARNQTTLKGIPANALRANISISNFKQKLAPQKQEITLPNPDGQFETFIIEPTNVVAKEVVHLYSIKTFRGYKKDDPTVLLSADISDNGFHAGIFTARHSYFIEPTTTQLGRTNQLAVYYKRDVNAEKVKCNAKHTHQAHAQSIIAQKRHRAVAKRTFRLAVVGSGEYGQQFGGSPYSATAALNAMASGVNMMNVVYLRDLGIEFTLVSNASMVFGNPDTDNIDVDDENDIFDKTDSIIRAAVGDDGFDVGHMVVWANLGGAAFPGICDDFDKAGGYSGADGSVTTLWIDYVAHEIGHQFNADHNFVSEECGTSADNTRYEPGEGSSIMSYADVCGGAAQYAPSSDPFFHYASIEVMLNYLEGLSCGTTETGGNASDPIPNAQSDITIPKQTPFVLVGNGTDANDGTANLTYSWEQYDGGSPAVTGSPNCTSTNAPLFRYRPPNNTGIRSFPQYSDVIAGNNDQQWEKLPCAVRDINFSLTVRDNNTSFGRVAQDLMKITVANTGPFNVTAPNGGETLTGNTASAVTWTVNGTNMHCPNVDILLSTDGGATFTVVADAVANNGSAMVTLPNTASAVARILVRCDVAGGFRSASTFYDVSNANFTVEEGAAQTVDMDMDGIEASVDCNDNDANIGAKQMPGTACNDGNVMTENDQIQADSCSCAGTMIAPCANNGGDTDMDGICADVDCNDNDASIGAKQTPGTACNDGNAMTENDQIQADSCSCMGTMIDPCADNGGDADNDGFCADEDCDDNNPNINPTATDIPDNGIDEDCDGMDEVTTSMSACPAPTNPQVEVSGPRTASISWASTNPKNRYTIQVRFKGQNRWIVTARILSNKVIIYAPANRTLEYRIQSNCDDADSDYSAIFEFTMTTNFSAEIAESRNNEADATEIDLIQYLEPTFALYPNPVASNLNLQLPPLSSPTISVYHISGKFIQQHVVEKGLSTIQLDVSALESGLYFVSIEIFGKQTISKRFIKR